MSSKCTHCRKSFQTISTRNRHLRKVHNDNSTSTVRASHIICPLCNTSSFTNFDLFDSHLLGHHDIRCNNEEFTFDSKTKFDAWKGQIEKETKSFYSLISTNSSKLGKILHFHCHRSNLTGFQSNCTVRAPKVSGSIKIKGVCPSRIRAEVYHDASKIAVTFSTTHVGHKNELRRQPLTETDKKCIIEQLRLGVSYDKIYKKAHSMENTDCSGMNLLTMKDIYNIAEKNNLTGKRSQNDFISVDSKIEEWNKGERKNVFFYKKIGENHEILEKDDFALAYMNRTMECMLKTYGEEIICADGTHDTNPSNFELTTILVLNEQKVGYPAVFLITNRRDSLIQEVMLSELKNIVGTIVPNYLMTDDSSVYYNAWTKIMGQIPQKLLCSWHVKKNWSLHTKAEISNPEIRKKVLSNLNSLLTETAECEFLRLKNDLMQYLHDNGEISFLNYLQFNYFQSDERVASWGHCYRKHVDINTNVQLESLYRKLKYKYFGRRTVQRLETCLDALDNLIVDKSWNRTRSSLRTKSTDPDLLVNQAHEQAAKMNFESLVETAEGVYRIHVQSQNNFYEVTLTDGSCECRTLRCPICDICVHRYSCTCYAASVKNNFCKHIHLVGMYVKPNTDHTYSTSCTQDNDQEEDIFQLDVSSITQNQPNEELSLIVDEAVAVTVTEDSRKQQCRTLLESVFDGCHSDNDYSYILQNLSEMKSHLHEANLSQPTKSRKRKIDQLTFFS